AKGRRAKTDYFERYEMTLVGRTALIRSGQPTNAIALCEPAQDIAKNIASNNRLLVAHNDFTVRWFMKMAEYHFEIFWRQFQEDQEMIIAAGAEPLRELPLRMLAESNAVCLFERIGQTNRGWAAPGTIIPQLTFGRFDRTFNSRMEVLRDSYNVVVPLAEKDGLSPLIRTFAHF